MSFIATISEGQTTGTFYLTPGGSSGNRDIAITTSPSLSYSGSPITYDATGTYALNAQTGVYTEIGTSTMSAPGTCTLSIAAPPGAFPSRFTYAGSMIRFLINFTDLSGVPTDPTTVTASVGTSYVDEVSLTPIKGSTGHWYADWDTSAAVDGIYYCDVAGTGTLTVESEIAITIKMPKL